MAWVTEVGAERTLLDAVSVALRCADKFRFMAGHFGAGAWAARRPALALSA